MLSRNDKLQRLFAQRFGETYRTVREYYADHARTVRIEDVFPWLSALADGLIAELEL